MVKTVIETEKLKKLKNSIYTHILLMYALNHRINCLNSFKQTKTVKSANS